MPSEPGRLDITFGQEGTHMWLDVAITSATSRAGTALAYAARDDRAARDEDTHKRNRHHGRATSFVGRAIHVMLPNVRARLHTCVDGPVQAVMGSPIPCKKHSMCQSACGSF